MIRKPAVAGTFYSGNPGTLRADIEKMIDPQAPKEKVIGAISPHAGYIYSGPVAGAVLSKIKLPDTCIILGPNHRGMGEPFAVAPENHWETPLGNVETDAELVDLILEESSYLEQDTLPHRYEHSIEVQLPFLQYLNPDVKIVPIALSHADGEIYDQIGKCIASAIQKSKRETLIIASSDMTHYESRDSAEAKDMKAIDAILKLNGDLLLEQISLHRISMCGYGPVIALISAAKGLGAQEAELVKYQTSGDVTGNYEEVVAYAGVIIK